MLRPKTDSETLTRKQLAQRLGVSVMTIHRWTYAKVITPTFRVGRVVRYDLAECLQALNRFKVREIRHHR